MMIFTACVLLYLMTGMAVAEQLRPWFPIWIHAMRYDKDFFDDWSDADVAVVLHTVLTLLWPLAVRRL